MNSKVIVKASLIWFLIAVIAVVNGILRQVLLQPVLGDKVGLILSGIFLALLIYFIAWLTLPSFGNNSAAVYMDIGAQWVVMTLILEFGLGYFAAGMLPAETFRVLIDVPGGNLFLLALITAGISPYYIAKRRNLIGLRPQRSRLAN
ncbi:hypothetical protein [Desulfurispira natronophila]|uniref:Uncharacterized protein n=1 Tax=Desulfurispira natronophila TaxID=682562 RepID=A0A7W7Y3G0_9BACT|nr:hypothetical protein [Desulfurispira natronophila]MBB5021381.1 hypothetical protein [Desulfurispira natronophila]